MASEPLTERLPGIGRLKHGNPTGNPANAARCGAKTRSGGSCKGPAMPNGRCRMHGGPSTGPKTEEGKDRIRASRTIHGRYSQATVQRRREARAIVRAIRDLVGGGRP